MSQQQAITPQSVPRRRLDLRVRKFRGKLLVAAGEHAFELDDVAAYIVKQVDGVQTLQQIGERVATEYDISVEEAVADTAELLSQLIEHDVLEIVS